MLKSRWVGVALLLAGIYILLDNFLQFPDGVFILMVGLAFILCRILYKKPALLIPGMIVSGVGSALMLRDLLPLTNGYDAAVFLLVLGASFLLLLLLNYRYTGSWPFYPGLALSICAFLCAYTTEPSFRALVSDPLTRYWPVLLILLGVIILIRGSIGKRGDKT